MTTRIKLRRDDTTNWEALNPVLALGEPGYNTTDNKIKIGDGVTAWVDLAYLTDAAGNDYTLPAATTNVLGGVKLGEGFVLNGSNQVTTSKLYSTNLSDANVHYRLEVDTNGVVVLPDQSIINGSTLRGVFGTGELNYTGITIGPDADHREDSWVWVDSNGAHVGTSYSTDAHTWNFTNDGNLQLPAGGDIINSNGDSVLGGGGGAANLGSFTIESNVLSVESGSDIYIETYETGGPGESRLVLKPQDDGVENPTRLEGSYGVGIWSNTTSGEGTKQWLFGTEGNLSLAGDLDVGAGDGHIYIDNALAGATSIRWLNIDTDATMFRVYLDGKADQNNEQFESGFNTTDGFYITTTSNPDGIYTNVPDDNTWYFDKTGNLVLPPGGDILNSNGASVLGGTGSGTGDVTLSQLSTIADTAAGVELTLNRPTTEWYSVYGDINTTNWSNATGAGSVVHSTDGNIYVLGSTTNYNNINDSHNLFLKYNTNGVLDWSRTWTDQTGMDCGSFNTSMRFLPVTAGKSDQETIYWSSFNPWNAYAYVGTMDTDGELVDGYGEVRAPVQLANVRLADLEVATGSNVYVVGARLGNNYANTTPFIATVNLDTHTANSAITISPPYIDITNTQSYTNFFKSVCAVNGNVIAVGTYYQNDIGYHWPILTKHVPGGETRTYHLTYSNPLSSYYGEVVAYSDFHDAVYVLINNEEGADFGVVGKVNSNFSAYDWMCRFGDNGIEVFLLGMTFDADGNIYILGELPGINNTDFVLIKMTDSADGVLWQRKIGSNEYDGSGRNTFGSTGWESSTGISVQGDHVVITGVTNKLNAGQPNAVTIKYPTDGSLIGDFGQYSVSTFDVGLVTDWLESINDLTAGTTVTAINGNAAFISHVTVASLIASTKTLDADYDQYHWDMTNNYLYVPERKWTFGEDGSITMPNAAKLYEDELGTLIIKSTGGTSINYNPYPFIANVPNNSIAVSGVTSNQNGVAVYVEKKISDTYLQYSQWQFNDNGGLGFPDGTTQYGAYLDQEIALDGGSAVSVFPINITNPRLADGGGAGARYGSTAPNYDGSGSGASVNPNEFTLTLNGGGA